MVATIITFFFTLIGQQMGNIDIITRKNLFQTMSGPSLVEKTVNGK